MDMKRSVLAVAMVAAGVAMAGENMLGRQSQNEGIEVVRRTKEVVFDGSLASWDLSGQIWTFADIGVRNRYSVKTAAMWDEDYLYLSFVWRDPTPLFSTVNPDFDPHDGWKSDAVQLRISTADAVSWVTTWYYTAKKQPAMTIDRWKDRTNGRGGMAYRDLRVAQEGGTDLGEGIIMKYTMSEDGGGFVQEVRIPWEKIYETKPEMKAGVVFRMGMEFLWGDATGHAWPIHRYADNMQPGKLTRIFFWNAVDVWGDARLVDKGPAEPRKYVTDDKRIEGVIPVTFKVPKAATTFTVVVEDKDGNRIRNLGGGQMVEDYEIRNEELGVRNDTIPPSMRPATDTEFFDTLEDKNVRTIQVGWDGLDDKGGLVSPGTYTIRGLSYEGLNAEYEMCIYKTGTPPRDTPYSSG